MSSIDFCKVVNFITQLADNSLLIYMIKTLGLRIIEVATLMVVIEMLRSLKRGGLFRAHKFRRYTGQTFVDGFVVPVALLLGFFTNLGCDGWS